ncbi:bola-like protein [Nemania diffusa]|nr:bola-like protein [Nemania diffusa]
MLGFQCRRVFASALRQRPTATRISPTNRAPLLVRARSSQRDRSARMQIPQAIRDRRASTASNAAADVAATSASQLGAVLPEKPDYLNDAESAIWEKLVTEFSPTELMVQDISGGCGSMYGIEITSEKFRGAGMLKQQRMVNSVLGEEMKSWHGVQLRTRIPQEVGQARETEKKPPRNMSSGWKGQ